MTLHDMNKSTFSRELDSGAPRFDALGGRTLLDFGHALAPANLSARQAKALGLLTSGISGPPSSISSHNAGLTSSLVSKLRARTDLLGSTLYKLTWKERATPSGRLISALRASARPISDSACIGWPSPAARDWKGKTHERWGSNARPLTSLSGLAGWNTPQAGATATSEYSQAGNTDYSRKTEALCGKSISGHNLDLPAEYRGPARLTASGEMLIGSSAGMESGGQLDPDHSRFLMGVPPEWALFEPTGMPSFSRKRKNS
jgi:hypothetical protein